MRRPPKLPAAPGLQRRRAARSPQPQALAEDAIGGVKRVFLEEDGSPKAKPIAIVAGAVTSLIVLRKIFHR
jgi:hypothetical protein